MAAPLDRTWYNALIDDDGSGTVGTVWNKAQIDALLDSVDARLSNVVDAVGVGGPGNIPRFQDVDTVIATAELTFDQAVGGLTITAQSPAVRTLSLLQPSGSPASRASIQVYAYSPSIELLEKDGIVNWHLGINNDAGKQFQIGGGHGPGAGVPPVLVLQQDGVVFVPLGRILFPSTPNPIAHPNILDDYREGTWSPTLIGNGGSSGQTYNVQEGTYIKVGRLVTCWGRVVLGTVGSFSGALYIGNLPFAAAAAQSPGVVTIPQCGGIGISFTTLAGLVATGGNYAALLYIPPAGSTSMLPVPVAAALSGMDLYFSIHYLTP